MVIIIFLFLLLNGFSESQKNDSSETPLYINMYGATEDNSTRLWKYLQGAYSGYIFMRDDIQFLREEYPDMTPNSKEDTYDFIVIGAGSAGATIAARLSEEKSVNVLLIEAGFNEHLIYDIPVFAYFSQLDDDINWGYRTEPSDKFCLAMDDRRCNWPRGKIMGGSSVFNYMIATRGNKRDYDNWADMGNEGWAYKDVLKYFKKLETIIDDKLKDDKVYHNTKGPVSISRAPFRTPLVKSFVEAGIELGYSPIDYNAGEQIGYSYIQTTIKDGRRSSSNKAYLHPIRGRKNLFLTMQSHVNRILIDPKSKRAYGVEFTKFGKTIVVNATKEVILSAGTIGSAQILMLSGIGPAEHLKEINVTCIKDAAVGKNLMDHLSLSGLIFLVNQPVSVEEYDILSLSQPYITDYFIHNTGPFGIPVGGTEGLAFINVDNSTSDWPNMELLFLSGSMLSSHLLHRAFGISEKYFNTTYLNAQGRASWQMLPMLLRPKSRGEILLRDNNPQSHPRIYPNYLDDPDDVRILIKGIRESIKTSKTDGMQRFKSMLHSMTKPGCEKFGDDSDEYWECALRMETITLYHHSGTCKMGPTNDPTSVVDSRLKVIGIDKLRVADASIMPMIVSGHTNIPVIMIGEKLADMVKEDWGFKID